MKGMKLMILVMLASFLVAGLWDSVSVIKQTVHWLLDPSVGQLLNWNTTLGMFIVVFIFSLITSIVQKYGTDQVELKKIRQEQKALQEEMKKYRDNPAKMIEFNKKQLEIFPKTMDLTVKPIIYTFIPFILLFRWFNDYFLLVDFKFIGFLSWFWFYLVFSIVFSSILRKALKIA